MYEKVNPSHPDKLADRIAGAMVDMAYSAKRNPKVAVEVLLGHGTCHVICESSAKYDWYEVSKAVKRITDDSEIYLDLKQVPQDPILALNQTDGVRCGDNGIFKGCRVTSEQRWLSKTMRQLYKTYPFDGKAVIDRGRLMLCQSNCRDYEGLIPAMDGFVDYVINPLGPWTGGIDVDTGATNRKLGSDMGDAVTGGGLHGKDLSKADVSVNIMCHLLAQKYTQDVWAACAIGDTEVEFTFEHISPIVMTYGHIVAEARAYIASYGGFEKFAEWGMI